MKTILVAVDGSSHSEKAAALATDLAVRYGAALDLVHVLDNTRLSNEEKHLAEVEFADEVRRHAEASEVEVVRGYGKLGMQPLILQHAEMDRVIRTALGEGLLKKYAHLATEKGVATVRTHLELGAPAQSILDAARDCKADTVVLGSRGASDMAGLFMGSVAHKVAHLSDATVITVK